MKAVILAGGFGTRISEETVDKPKPMVTIGGRPILWHIMKILDANGIKEFVIALGYRGDSIKEYFLNFKEFDNDLTVDLGAGITTVYDGDTPDWKVHLIDTGLHTQTGGRLRRLRSWIGDEPFLFTYGDGVADIDVASLARFHRTHGKLATVTTVRPPARFGNLAFSGDRVTDFYEKQDIGESWINGGYFMLQPEAIEYITGDADIWERGPVEGLSRDGQLMGYRHTGFWSCMDTLKERTMLEEMWSRREAPWRIWGDGPASAEPVGGTS
ncbi:MAG: glucose-1-phosphate cytidylyltransferase [Trueperaceae bacterium]|nr:glucose-1-phosphate cytidylyltransferase [Trueperaceae bacterium]